MKVIEYGHIEPIRARCQRCGALLEFSEREARDFNDRLYIICPMCGRGIWDDKWIDFESDFDYDVISTTEVVKPYEKDTEWTIVDM